MLERSVSNKLRLCTNCSHWIWQSSFCQVRWKEPYHICLRTTTGVMASRTSLELATNTSWLIRHSPTATNLQSVKTLLIIQSPMSCIAYPTSKPKSKILWRPKHNRRKPHVSSNLLLEELFTLFSTLNQNARSLPSSGSWTLCSPVNSNNLKLKSTRSLILTLKNSLKSSLKKGNTTPSHTKTTSTTILHSKESTTFLLLLQTTPSLSLTLRNSSLKP